jgi:ribonucleoside-diphosphate reductase alpha chain
MTQTAELESSPKSGIHSDAPNTTTTGNGSYSPPQGVRNYLPDERVSITQKFNVGGYEGYITVGLYPDRQPGELFVTMGKEGSTVSGLMSTFGKAVSIGLQHGVPLKVLCGAFSRTRFEPSGWTSNPAIGCASSVMDYIFRWLEMRFLNQSTLPCDATDVFTNAAISSAVTSEADAQQETSTADGPLCRTCGAVMRRNGSCHACPTCGWTSGCA